MKPPRLPTPEELLHWQESNRWTTVKEGAQPAPLPSGEAARLGEPREPSRSGEGMSAPALRPKAPLAALPTREANRRLRAEGNIEATLDLHGMGKLEAYAAVQQFIARQRAAGRRHLAIITGKGRHGEAGILRSHLPHWLNEPSLRSWISAFTTARAEKGGTGVTHVLLKRK